MNIDSDKHVQVFSPQLTIDQNSKVFAGSMIIMGQHQPIPTGDPSGQSTSHRVLERCYDGRILSYRFQIKTKWYWSMIIHMSYAAISVKLASISPNTAHNH